MYEYNLVPGFERRNSQQTVIDDNPSPDYQSFPLNDINVGSSLTVYRSLYAEQMFHLTKYVNKLAQYPNTEVILIIIRDEPSENSIVNLPQKKVFTFASSKLQPLLARIERDHRFRQLSHTVNPQGNGNLLQTVTALSFILLAFTLGLSLTILLSVLIGSVFTTTLLVSSLSLFLWGRVLKQRKSPTKYQALGDEMDPEMDPESVLNGSHKEISSHLPANRAEITSLQAAITGIACEISTNRTKILFHLESEETTFDYGSSDLKVILGSCRNISSVEEEEPQRTARRLDKRIDYKMLCLVFSTVIVFDVAAYFKWNTVEHVEVFAVSACYCMIFNVIFGVRLLYMYSNDIE